MFIVVAGSGCHGLKSVEDQVSADIGNVIQASKPDLMAKRVCLQCEAAEYEDLSGEKSLTLDGIVVD